MAECKIVMCDCIHTQQDEINGKGKRVYNPAFKKGANLGTYRCTVCKKEKKVN